MNVIIEDYPIPERGRFTIDRTIHIHVSAQEAQRRCNTWLAMDVAHLLRSQEPDLYIRGEHVVWRLPIVLTAKRAGIVGRVGHIEMDVKTGEIAVDETQIEQMLARSEQLAETRPPYKRNVSSPPAIAPRPPMPTLTPAFSD